MDLKDFQSLLKYYLSCLDAEEATHLKLRKNQEYKTHIFIKADEGEQLFSQDLPELKIPITDLRQKGFIEKRAPDQETLIDLYYGFPILLDEKDMLAPLFFIEVEARFSGGKILCLLPKANSLSINRMHFINRYDVEETQRICEELEGEFGSFAARMKATETYIPSLAAETKSHWMTTPILFRTNLNSSKSGLRYDLTYLLKNENALWEKTALRSLVQGKHCEIEQDQAQRQHILEISALNTQQETAVVNGLQADLSVVTGPPGTGKTQVVTALLASAVFANKTVLFASNNNMPVDGVYDRLGKSMETVGNWILRLGNQQKRDACYKTIFMLLERLKGLDRSKHSLDQEIEKLLGVEHDISRVNNGLKRAHDLEKEIDKLYSKENAIVQKLPTNWLAQFATTDPTVIDHIQVKKLKRLSAPGIFLWLHRHLFGMEAFKEKHNALLTTIITKHKNLTACEGRLLIDEDWGEAVKKARATVRCLILHQDWVAWISRRRSQEAQIARCPSITDLSELKEKKSVISRALLDQYWLKNIWVSTHHAIEALNHYFKDIDDYEAGRHKRLEKSLSLLKRFFPIWITTNQSVSAVIPPQAALFDLVVIDEAGQCDIPSIIPLLYRAKHAVIIGDPHQFKHITSLRGDLEHAIAQKTGIVDILDRWSFTKRSAFDCAFSIAQCASFLKQHYRCHPDIIEFSNRTFYEGRLVTQVPLSQFQRHLPIEENGLVWHHTKGQAFKAQKGAWNPAEVNKAAEIFDRFAQQGLFSIPDVTYGIITPFRKQVEEMRKKLSSFRWFKSIESSFTIGTAHSFQGSECDILIYSPVITEGLDKHLIEFAAAQPDLINVTVTRAKNLLYIVGDLDACQSAPSQTPLYQLAAYAEERRQYRQIPLNKIEKITAGILDELKLVYVPQYPLGSYRLDFLVNAPSGERYDLEIDGDIHLTAKAVQYDERRDAYVTNQGFKILRLSARDIFHKPEIIKERLMRI